MSVDPSASGGVAAPVKDSREIAQVYSVVPACIYCCRVVDDCAHHFEDIDRDIFAPFVVGECENIHSWISLIGDLVFSHQGEIYGFKFPKRFFWRSLSEISLFLFFVNPNHLKT